MHIYDSHAHVDQCKDIDGLMQRAVEAKVKGIVAIAMDLQSCRDLLELKKKYSNPELFIGMGMHPSEANEDDVQTICDLARSHRDELTVIGEIGLDFWYKWVRKDKEKKDAQRRIFRTFLELAKELDLPAVIHTRGTWAEALETTKEVGLKAAEFHWYSGPLDVLDDIIEAGYYVSTSPSIANSEETRRAMNHAPMEKTLIETDSPVTFRNRETGDSFVAEPKDVWRTLKAYAVLKNIKEEDALAILNANAETFFRI